MAIADSNASGAAVKQMGFFRTTYHAGVASAQLSLSVAQLSLKVIEGAKRIVDENVDDMVDQTSKTLKNMGFAHVRMNIEMREALDVPSEITTIKEYETYLLNKKKEEVEGNEEEKGNSVKKTPVKKSSKK